MADLPDHRTDTGEPTSKPPAAPRWVKVLGIIAIVLLVVVVIGLITGQLGPGGRHGPGRHLGGGDTTSRSDQHNTGSVGGPADAKEATRTVQVTTLDTMAFQPARITVSAGETVTFEVTNPGQAAHEFTLGDAAMQQEHAQAMAHGPAGVAPHSSNSITVHPAETKRLTWRFGDAATLEFACHEPGHYQAGMRGRIKTT